MDETVVNWQIVCSLCRYWRESWYFSFLYDQAFEFGRKIAKIASKLCIQSVFNV